MYNFIRDALENMRIELVRVHIDNNLLIFRSSTGAVYSFDGR
jgi:hypothetical protein